MNTNKKVAVVLGAISGIGYSIALDLLQQGIRVACSWHDWPERLAAMENGFAETGTDYWIERIDLTDTVAIGHWVSGVVSRFGRMDFLINNIERGGWPVVHGRYTLEQWDLELATTLRAKQWVFEAAPAPLEGFRRRCRRQHLFHRWHRGPQWSGQLSFQRRVCRGQSRCFVAHGDLGPPRGTNGACVNELMLGVFETRHGPSTRGWDLLNEDQRQAIIDHTLMNRIGKMDDVVRAVRFLLEDAPFMTGSVIRLDGGYVLGGERIAPMPDGVL